MKQKIISLSLVIVMAFGLLAMPVLAANPWTKASDWAVPEMEKANGQGLIPDALKNKDLTSNVTRAEFAAVAVKVYENLTGTKATAPSKNPFDDTSDAEVLKAYNTGLMVGVSESKFDPGAILNREQMATALTRVLKRAYIPGWTMQADGDYTLNFAQPSKFADDANTSDWAKPSVYFMFAKEIISGTGGNQFSPKQNATREQSVAIGLRIVEKLKGKPLDYAKSGTDNPPSGGITAELVGPWRGALDGYSHYFMFRGDGTFSYLVQMPDSLNFVLKRGDWSLSDDTIYCTNIMRLSWNGSEYPSSSYSGSEWAKIENEYLEIRFYENEEAKKYGLPYRKIEILNIVSDSPYSKGATLKVTNENLPSWAYLGD